MGSRHLQTLIAMFLSGLWGAAVYFAHERGHLGFLDRIESAMTDLRTLARGVRVPPDFVTIVAIDDTMVEQGGSYPLARIDLARIVDAIARLQPKVIAIDLLLVDRGSDDGDEALARSLAGRASVIAAAAVFAQASQSIAAENGPLARLPRAERFLLPLKRFADHALPVTFYGPRRTMRTVSAASALAGEIAADDIRQRIVVVGATVTAASDFFPTPF